MVEHPVQAALVTVVDRIETLFAHPREPRRLRFAFMLEQPGTEHRRDGQRHQARHQDRDADGHRKFAHQTPDDATHQ